MPFNGSGTYVATALPGSWNPAVSGSSATPADWNTLLADLSTALSTTITKDGQTTVTANIPMGNHKITGLADATAQTDALNQQGALYVIDQQDATAVSFIDFTNIAATVNNLKLVFEFLPNTAGTSFGIQTYGADGVLDTGASDYSTTTWAFNTIGGNTISGITAANFSVAGVLSTNVYGMQASLEAFNIQAATDTKFNFHSTYTPNSAVGVGVSMGTGSRLEADRITGIRILVDLGTFTGKATLFGSV